MEKVFVRVIRPAGVRMNKGVDGERTKLNLKGTGAQFKEHAKIT